MTSASMIRTVDDLSAYERVFVSMGDGVIVFH